MLDFMIVMVVDWLLSVVRLQFCFCFCFCFFSVVGCGLWNGGRGGGNCCG